MQWYKVLMLTLWAKTLLKYTLTLSISQAKKEFVQNLNSFVIQYYTVLNNKHLLTNVLFFKRIKLDVLRERRRFTVINKCIPASTVRSTHQILWSFCTRSLFLLFFIEEFQVSLIRDFIICIIRRRPRIMMYSPLCTFSFLPGGSTAVLAIDILDTVV